MPCRLGYLPQWCHFHYNISDIGRPRPDFRSPEYHFTNLSSKYLRWRLHHLQDTQYEAIFHACAVTSVESRVHRFDVTSWAANKWDRRQPSAANHITIIYHVVCPGPRTYEGGDLRGTQRLCQHNKQVGSLDMIRHDLIHAGGLAPISCLSAQRPHWFVPYYGVTRP